MEPGDVEKKLQILEQMGFSRTNPLSILTSQSTDQDKGIYKSKCFMTEDLRLNSYRK